MGCDFTPEVLPVSPFTKCKTSITNLRSKLVAIFPLKRPKILACTIRHFIILNMEDRTDELACSFSSEITCALLISNPNVKLLAGKATGEIEILHLQKKTEKFLLGHSSKVTFLLMLKNGQLCSGSDDGDVFIWDLKTKMDEFNFGASTKSITCLCELKDGRLIVISSDDRGRMYNLKLQTLEIEWKIIGAFYLIQIKDKRVVYSSDGDIIVSQIEKLLDVSKEMDRGYVKNHQPDIYIKKAHEGMISMLLELKNGDIASSWNDGMIKIWNLAKGFICIQELEGHHERVSYMSEIPNYRLLSCADDGWVRVWS